MPVFARFLPEMLKETPFVLVDERRFFYGGEGGIRTHRVSRWLCFRASGIMTNLRGFESRRFYILSFRSEKSVLNRISFGNSCFCRNISI